MFAYLHKFVAAIDYSQPQSVPSSLSSLRPFPASNRFPSPLRRKGRLPSNSPPPAECPLIRSLAKMTIVAFPLASSEETEAVIGSSSGGGNGGGRSSTSRPTAWNRANNNRRRMAFPPAGCSPVDCLRQSIFRTSNRLLVNLLSEFFATFILLFVGSGAVAQFVLGGGKLNNFAQVSLAWGVLIALCVFATYHTSGGHMNPAVSLATCSLGKLPLAHFPLYALAQTFGAFLGAALCFHVYADAIDAFDGGNRSVGGPTGTAGIFCSFPHSEIGHYTAFIDQIVGTALLLLFICALVDPRNRVPAYLHPIGFGAAIFMISSSYGMNLGSPINPARDFGPRLFLLFAGYGWEAFSWHGYYFWIPIIAPLFGALLGTWLYQAFIGLHVPDGPEEGGAKKQLGMDEEEEEGNPLNSVVP